MRDAQAKHGLPFLKMHGLGNDFVVIDRRESPAEITPAFARALGDRHFGVGFDQLAAIDADTEADFALSFWNADGTPSATCGNATRCIARREMERLGRSRLTIRTPRGLLGAETWEDGSTAVNMGAPILDWAGIPLAEEMDTLELPIEGAPTATGMGNPHCTFFVEDAELIPLAEFGARYEHHPLFPERTNVEVVQVLSETELRLRIWERGTGITLASGSCACAAAVAAARRGLTGRKANLRVDGGALLIDWRDDGVWLAGPTQQVFEGRLSPDFLSGLS
jgi:diaminopimelate epimerase